MDVKIKNIYIFYAAPRSGHHAIIHWLASHLKGDSLYFNKCHVEDNKIVNASKNHSIYLYKNSEIVTNKAEIETKISNIIYNFETSGSKKHIEEIRKIFKPTDKITSICVNRDHYNWTASFYKKHSSYIENSAFKQKWINNINCSIEGIYDIDINFNKWFVNRSYREIVIKKLDLIFTDKGKNFVMDEGSGSSFDKLNYQFDAEKMDVLNRWKSFVNDEAYLEYVSDIELATLTKKYFDFILKL